MDVHPQLPQGLVVLASIIVETTKRLLLLRRNGGPVLPNLHYLLSSVAQHFSFLFSIIALKLFFISAVICSLSHFLRNVCRGYLDKKGLGFEFGQFGIEPVWIGLCKTWRDWLSQLLFFTCCGSHGIELNPTIFNGRLCKGKIMPAAGYLCLMFFACVGSPREE